MWVDDGFCLGRWYPLSRGWKAIRYGCWEQQVIGGDRGEVCLLVA